LGRAKRGQPVIEVRLAVIAPVLPVGQVIGIEMLIGVDEPIRHAKMFGQRDGVSTLPFGIARRHTDARQHARSEDPMRGGGNQRAVHAARVRHER
jgi:hypothetical protein